MFAGRIAVVSADTNRVLQIIDRRSFFNEILEAHCDDANEMLCYRDVFYYHYVYGRNKKGLNKYAYSVNSQDGEDGILQELFRRIGTTSKYAVEFGAWDGIYLNNIRNLVTKNGFSALFIEGVPEKAEVLRNNYKTFPNVRCAEAYVGFRGDNTLDSILSRNDAPQEIDIISIDVDGCDYHVWQALKKYRPRVIIIEYNPTVPNEIVCINPESEDSSTGSSAAALVELARKKRYSLVAVTGSNLVFVVDEEYNKLQIWNNTLDALMSDTRIRCESKYFHTFDQRLILTGRNRFIWKHGRDSENFAKDSDILFSNL